MVGERLDITSDTILPEAACTSLQLHLRVAPEDFAAHWNAAQAIAGVQVAIAANSPFLAGRALWHETRIPLFEQATDTRPIELRNQGVRPRVWFGERWITSTFDLFEENTRYFPALLPVCSDVDPLDEVAQGRSPSSPSSACTTAPSTAGTAPSTTWSTGTPTCGWRTGCYRPAPRWWTRWPTRPSTTAWSARSSRPTAPSGRR
ncbi:hypothetical protein MTP03_40330 [Tsukamurella sp. PLM1]|nr:hypothetical protein MTP03_40330 [Tsukamurella sp. PLM1]